MRKGRPKEQRITAGNIGFTLGPCFNAGRIEMQGGVDLL